MTATGSRNPGKRDFQAIPLNLAILSQSPYLQIGQRVVAPLAPVHTLVEQTRWFLFYGLLQIHCLTQLVAPMSWGSKCSA